MKMYSCISLGLEITNITIPGNIVERFCHISNVTSYENFQLKMLRSDEMKDEIYALFKFIPLKK
jgi:hypothetical protein